MFKNHNKICLARPTIEEKFAGSAALQSKTPGRIEGQNLFIAPRRKGAKKGKTMKGLRMRVKTTK